MRNQLEIEGNLAGDPCLYVNTPATKVVGFAIVNEYDRTGRTHKVKLNCKAYGSIALALYNTVKKFDKIDIKGHLHQRTWEKDGIVKTEMLIIVDSFNRDKESQLDFNLLEV